MILRLAKKIVFATLTLVITLVVVDLVLHGAARLSPRIDQVTAFLSAKIPDAQLGHRPNGRPVRDGLPVSCGEQALDPDPEPLDRAGRTGGAVGWGAPGG